MTEASRVELVKAILFARQQGDHIAEAALSLRLKSEFALLDEELKIQSANDSE